MSIPLFCATLLFDIGISLLGGSVQASIKPLDRSTGMRAEIQVTGDTAGVGEHQLTCKFYLPGNSPKVKAVDSILSDTSRGRYSVIEYYRNFIDTVIFYGDTNVTFLSTPVWTGHIEPGEVYEFSVRVKVNSEKSCNVYVRSATRYGSDMLGTLGFNQHPVKRFPGYIIEKVESAGKVTNVHRWVSDSTLPGFVRYELDVLPPDTTFDTLGNVLYILKRAKKDSLPQTGPKVIPTISPPAGNHPRHKSAYLGVQHVDDGRDRIGETWPNYLVTGLFQYKNEISGQFQPCTLNEIWVYYKDVFGSWEFAFTDGTSFDGSFDLLLDQPDALVLAVTVNPVTNVYFTDTHKNEVGAQPSVYAFGFAIQDNTTFADVIVPDSLTSNSVYPAPYFIADVLYKRGWVDLFRETGHVVQLQS